MALKRRLVVAVVTASSLLCVYVLRGHLERPASWSTPPLKHSPRLSGSGSPAPQEPPHNETSADLRPRPPAAQPVLTAASTTKTRLKPADTSDPGVSEATSRSKGGDRARTKGPPALPRQQLVRADGPTDPPFIGDAYRSEDVPLQTDCRDGIRARVKKTAFGGRFLDHIPVLQWAADVTLEEHRRLSRYPGAHGWGGVDYGTLVETLSVLNASANRLLLDDWNHRGNASACSRCAVVGNGGILKESKMGEEIDGHHYVFRTNGAIVKGFEQDVGSRTTHYTFSTNTLMNSLRSYVGFGAPPQSPETRYVFLPDHDRDFLLMKAAATHRLVERGRERAKDPTEYFGADVSAEKLKMLHPDFIRYLRNRFLRSSTLTTQYKALYRPSTGAVMLLAALHACDQVSAYGFMTPDYSNYSDHYYDKSYRPVGFFINHDLRLEMALWQQLQQEGLIRLYMHR